LYKRYELSLHGNPISNSSHSLVLFLQTFSKSSSDFLPMAPALENKAAWQAAAKVKALQVGPGPKPDPSENELVIKVAYAAVNPTDCKVSTNSSQ
jgi:hypothetical protein